MKKLFLGCIALSLCSGAFADFRVWQDRDGNEIEAEFVRELFDKVTLRKKDGTEVRMEIDEFSDLDQKYFRVMVPPELEIKVRSDSRTKEKLFSNYPRPMDTDVRREGIEIMKKSKRPFTSRLYADLYMVGEEVNDNGNKVLLHKESFDFIFPEGGRTTFPYKSRTIEVVKAEAVGIKTWRGETYDGYILMIRDAAGNILVVDTDINGDWASDPEVIENLKNLWIRGAASIRLRHFDRDTGEKVEPARVKYYYKDIG